MASITITNTRALVDGTVKACNLKLVDGKIKGVMPAGDTYGKTYDAKDNLVIPGFVDIHTHGGDGVDFNSADANGCRAVRDFFAGTGVTTFLPTVRTDSEETMLRSILSVARAKNSLGCPQIYGIHLEGPFIAAAYRGNMEQEYLQPCSYLLFKRLQDASGGLVKLITVSPELTGAPQLIGKLAAEGVRVSLGHSGASYEQAAEAIEAGAVTATHMFQYMSMLTPMEPSICSALLESDCFCEVICDPTVLHPAIIRLLMKIKGLQRLIAVTDSNCTNHFFTADQMLKYLILEAELTLPQAITMLSENPARLLGIYHAKGSLSVGKDADFSVVDKDYNILATFSCGEMIYSH